MFATHINVKLTLPERIIYFLCDEHEGTIKEMSFDNKVRDEIVPDENRPRMMGINDYGKPKQYGPARPEPLLPGMYRTLTSFQIYVENIFEGDELNWTIYADSAESQNGKLTFDEIEIV